MLVERDQELSQLESLITGAARGDGVAVMLEGVAGIGKTALLRSARESVRESGFQALVAVAS